MAQSPLFMLSVLDTAIKDDELLQALQVHEQIGPALIEMMQARLASLVVLQLTQSGEYRGQIAPEKNSAWL
jgi:hypothetical protein